LPHVILLSDHARIHAAAISLFVLQMGLPASLVQLDVNKHGSSKEALVQLALHCIPLWEAKCLVRCACYMSSSRTAAYASEAAARMLFRLSLNSCGSSSNASREVLKRFKVFALTVHPDKVPKQLQGISGVQEVFTEGFKALQRARELLMGCK
jgi:hypothetical protein